MSSILPESFPETSKNQLRVWLKLLKITGRINSEIRRRFRDEFQTTLPRFDVMAALYRYPNGLKMSEISSQLRVSNGNATGIVDRLSLDGLVLRVAVVGDRRASLVSLTKVGQEVFRELAQRHEKWISQLLGDIAQDDLQTLSTVLDTVNERIRNDI